jgi:hypothetical protein
MESLATAEYTSGACGVIADAGDPVTDSTKTVNTKPQFISFPYRCRDKKEKRESRIAQPA